MKIDKIQGQGTSNSSFPKLQSDSSFAQILNSELSNINLTNHASKRLESRGISLSSQDISKMNYAMEKLSKKGSRESLVLMDNRAFVVNPKSKTIITAVSQENLKDNVFTNIDSAIIL
ncbi:flagellar operon protein [Thermodesulfobium narugense DSM 14796]|uniref:Flagellar operon protein n=1 Tax=Thermodesulfobium narugense DSM 14796 TaxID=747365 RepID=M1E983_9BACT|nr:TIGR02530 family flagellar biosynthesis protein [Thermodesulfobium narugense]AEE15420.1 flagellar operon protein [Thermodesulfobium narugense DSM 14796]